MLPGWHMVDPMLFEFLDDVHGNGRTCPTIFLDDRHQLSSASCVAKLGEPMATGKSDIKVAYTFKKRNFWSYIGMGQGHDLVVLRLASSDEQFNPFSAPTLAEHYERRGERGQSELSPNSRLFVLRWRLGGLELAQVEMVDNRYCPDLEGLPSDMVCAYSDTAEMEPDSDDPLWLVDISREFEGDLSKLDSNITRHTLVHAVCRQRSLTSLECGPISMDKPWVKKMMQGKVPYIYWHWF